MNKRQKEIYGLSLEDEKALLKQLEQNYINALADIKVKIKKLQEMPETQSRAYQIDFQKHLETEINGYLDVLESSNVQSIEDYYQLCYENGFIGNAYTLQSYNVGVIAPINQDDVINATKMTVDDVKLSTKIAGNTALLKKQVVQEIQRGFSVAMPFADIARNISARGQADMNRAMRIARTEGNRIYNTSAVDYAKIAKDAGCDIVKQWVAVLDARTRDSHQAVDGEWVEIDAKFSNGLRYPCDPNGSAAEVVNCRCKVAHLPRWYVEKDYPRLRRDNETGEIIECRNYAEFKEKYLSASDRVNKIRWDKVASSTDREQFDRYKKALGKDAPKTLADFCKIKYNGSNEYAVLKHNYKDANLRLKIRNGKNLEIEVGKQGKHIKGHNNYKQGKSYLTISIDDAQALVNKYAGTGDLVRDSKGRWKQQEIVFKNKMPIGFVVSAIDGEEIETSYFKIHYSKSGTHIVPYTRKG